MEADGIDRHDPVRFCYIRSLAARARGKPAPVAAVIREKADAALAAYETDFNNARTEAEKTVERVRVAFPDAVPGVQRFFEENEFKQVDRFARQLDRRRPHSGLSALIERMGRNRAVSPEQTAQPALDGLMRRQEQEIVSSMGLAGDGEFDRAGKTEMRSVAHFKETMKKLRTDQLVTRSLHDRPENPGPLNAQMLAIRTLAALRRISPEYLARFVTYIDTLIWLQAAGEDTDKRKKKT